MSSCGVCGDVATGEGAGGMLSNPDKHIPLFENETMPKTCQEYDDELKAIDNADDCFDEKLDWEVDLHSYCGCENGGIGSCTLCMGDEEFVNSDNITGGYPLTNVPLDCEYVNGTAPYLNTISMCEEFQEWYGIGLCCKTAIAPTPAPTAEPTSGCAPSALVGQCGMATLFPIFTAIYTYMLFF